MRDMLRYKAFSPSIQRRRRIDTPRFSGYTAIGVIERGPVYSREIVDMSGRTVTGLSKEIVRLVSI